MNAVSVPAELFHYTSAAGALGILRGGTLRASMLHYMNDGQEFSYAIGIARRQLAQIQEAKAGEEHLVDSCLDYLGSIKDLAIFASALSEDGDLLSQWRAYSPPEGGYAIGFQGDRINELAAQQGFRLIQCEYDLTRQLAMMQPVIAELLSIVEELGSSASVTAIHDRFSHQFALVAATLKHPSFSEEKEWRLVTEPRSFDITDYIAKQTLIVPFVPFDIAANPFPVSRVIVGPHRYPDLAGRSLRFMTSAVRGWPVRVDASKTPYRVIG